MIDEPLYSSEEEKLAIVERNLYLQSNRVVDIVQTLGRSLKMTPELIRELHRLALQDIYSDAGQFRDRQVKIIGSNHVPIDSECVPGLVQDMCDHINTDDPDNKALISTAAFLLWRLNWIHPFRDGNGRTSRAATYLLLCGRLGFILPGQPTLASYIVQNRRLYLDALVDADTAVRSSSVVDVSKMKSFLDDWFDKQLESVPPPPRPVIVRQQDNPAIRQPGAVIMARTPLPPDARPPRPVIVQQPDSSFIPEPGSVTYRPGRPPSPPPIKTPEATPPDEPN